MDVKEYLLLTARPKGSKYRNVPIEVEGFRFDSKREGHRWAQLRHLERAGEIANLKRQVVFPLVVNGHLIAKYRADFVYEMRGERIVEDSKGVRTDAYRMKRNLMKAILGVEILET